MSLRTNINPALSTSALNQAEENIHSFLAKPYAYYSGVFSSTDTTVTFPRYNYFVDFLPLEPYASKLKGFLGMKADDHTSCCELQ